MPVHRAKTVVSAPAAPATGPVIKELTFTANGDDQGLFYWMGTFYGNHAWINPQALQLLTSVMSSITSGNTTALLSDRLGNTPFYSNNADGQWVAFDVGAGRTLKPSYYLLRHDNETGYYLRSWKLQGSNNVVSNSVADLGSATWSDLTVHTEDTTINSPNGWGGWIVPEGTAAYRWLRILMTGTEASGSKYLVLGEVEFYGTFTRPALSA